MTLKKIARGALFSSIPLVFLFACAGGRLSKEMVVYVNQDIMNISQLEILALKHYAAVTGDHYTNDERVHSALKNDVIPLYKRFYTLLKEVSPVESEIKRIHRIYVHGAEEILNGFNAKKMGLENKDEGLVRLANLEIEEGGKKVGRWRAELYQLITKNKSVRMKSEK
jgi:hypothetical protein